ncbi:NADP-dependent oxidoreductase [Allopusillimonas ginsengisoli]|nr:NADP-dependent oxidoreductase [Allopusillimonas ginsengisoli]
MDAHIAPPAEPGLDTQAASYRRIVLDSRPSGRPTAESFRLEEVNVSELQAGQILVRNHYLSIDPYMLGRMTTGMSYAPSQPLGAVMIGETVGVVVQSRNRGFSVGDHVVGQLGWQEMAVSGGQGLRKVDVGATPMSAHLGVLGMTGVTAWYGMTQICSPVAGSTVVVSAAAGAVGGVAIQLAKARGCRVLGIAGGSRKCGYVVDSLGADACVDYKKHADIVALGQAVRKHAPDGVDSYFDNVNGWMLEAMLPLMSRFGRIALCGMISRYGDTPMQLTTHSYLLISRLRAQGFIVWDHLDLWPQALEELTTLLQSGSLLSGESIAEGIEAAPAACIGLLSGGNLGKQLVKLVQV